MNTAELAKLKEEITEVIEQFHNIYLDGQNIEIAETVNGALVNLLDAQDKLQEAINYLETKYEETEHF